MDSQLNIFAFTIPLKLNIIEAFPIEDERTPEENSAF
jgi:hypothetical protein